MKDHNQLIACAGLIEEVLHVRKDNIDFLSLVGHESYTILVNLETSNSLSTDKVRSHNQVVKDLAATTFHHL